MLPTPKKEKQCIAQGNKKERVAQDRQPSLIDTPLQPNTYIISPHILRTGHETVLLKKFFSHPLIFYIEGSQITQTLIL